MQEPEQDSPQPAPSGLIGPAAANFAKQYWKQAQTVLIGPRVFFETMPTTGGLREPAVFLLVAASVNAVLTGLMGFNFMLVPVILISSTIGVFLGALVASALSQMLGGKGSYEATFRVFAYSEAPLLFAWIPVIGLIAAIYTWVLNYFGLKKVQELSEVKTVMVVILSGLLTVMVLLLGACGMFLRSIFHF